jgi:hypothetical protein
MGWLDWWHDAQAAMGFGRKKKIEQRMPIPETDKWSRLLKALQVSQSALLPAIEREISRGFNPSERLIEPKKEGLFFDGLIIGKKTEVLDTFCKELDSGAVSARLMSKIPSLRDWALGVLKDDSLLRVNNSEVVAWARSAGRFSPGKLRESHLAEAIEGGRVAAVKRELGDAGLDKLDAVQMGGFMEAFAQRKENGLSSGLDAQGLEAFAQSLGGWAEAAEAVAGLSKKQLMDLIDDLLVALQEEELLEKKVFERAKAMASKRAREIIAKAVATQAAKSDRPVAMLAAIKASAEALGVSQEKAARMKIEEARVKVGQLEVTIGLAGGASLYAVATLSNAKRVQAAIVEISTALGSISRERLDELVVDVKKGVRGLVMRASGEEREATKAWRETVKDWESGVLGKVSLGEMQELVNEKIAAREQVKVQPGGPK